MTGAVQASTIPGTASRGFSGGADLLTRAERLHTCAGLFVLDATNADMASEYLRLFGVGDGRPSTPLPLVPVCACGYFSEGEHGCVDEVLDHYSRADFDFERSPARCPAHIATELEFLAHCLERSARGDTAISRIASDFTVSHLFPWGAVFAAATSSRAKHPVMRFAADSLEHLLFFELAAASALE